MGNGNDPPARIPYLEISDENMTSPNSGLMGVQKVAENTILFPPVVAHLSAAAAEQEEEEAAEALIIQKQK